MATPIVPAFLHDLNREDVKYIVRTLGLDVKPEVKDSVIRSLLRGEALDRYDEWIAENCTAEPLKIINSQHLKAEVLHDILTQLKDRRTRSKFFNWCEEILDREDYYPHNYTFDKLKLSLDYLIKEDHTSSTIQQGSRPSEQLRFPPDETVTSLAETQPVENTATLCLEKLIIYHLAEMCDENMEKTIKIFLSIAIYQLPPQEKFIPKVVRMLLIHVFEIPDNCYLYVLLCKAEIEEELKLEACSPFAESLLSHTQYIYKNCPKDEWMRPLICFVGYLYNHDILSPSTIKSYIFDLVMDIYPDCHGQYPEPPHDEEKICLLLYLFEIIGKKFINSTEQLTTGYMARVLDHLEKLEDDLCVDTRAKFEKLKTIRLNLWERKENKAIVNPVRMSSCPPLSRNISS